ncbi:uncharacterized protein PEZ65_015942 [Lycodopsis pacificus]
MALIWLSADETIHASMRDEELEASEFVSKHKHETIDLKTPAGATWRVGDLEDTIYSGKDNVVNGWNKFYLPDIVNMKVMGVVEGTSCPCDQLVLMTCEDRKLYAYDGDELHLVASSLKQLSLFGMEYPAAESYYKGEAFRKMTDEDWDEVRKGDVGKRLDKEHHELVTAKKVRFPEESPIHQTQNRSLQLILFCLVCNVCENV